MLSGLIDAVSFSMVMCSMKRSIHTEIFRFFLLFQLRRMVFLVTVRVMSIVFMLWLGSVADDNLPKKQSDGESGIQQFNMTDILSVISFQKC